MSRVGTGSVEVTGAIDSLGRGPRDCSVLPSAQEDPPLGRGVRAATPERPEVSPARNAGAGDADDDVASRWESEFLSEEPALNRRLLKTKEVACLLRVDVEWVRANRVALGAVKLGDGPKAHLRFPQEAVEAYLAARRVGAGESAENQPSRKPRRSRRGVGAPSLRATGQAVMDW
jgi:hypothetical protein